MATTIRATVSEDFLAVLRLLHQLWPDAVLPGKELEAAFMRGLASGTQQYLCAEHGGRVVAFCSVTLKNSLWLHGHLAHIDELIVDEAHRGKQIGTELLIKAVDVARGWGAARVEVDSAFHRVEAHKFYVAHGFENRAYLFSSRLGDEGSCGR